MSIYRDDRPYTLDPRTVIGDDSVLVSGNWAAVLQSIRDLGERILVLEDEVAELKAARKP